MKLGGNRPELLPNPRLLCDIGKSPTISGFFCCDTDPAAAPGGRESSVVKRSYPELAGHLREAEEERDSFMGMYVCACVCARVLALS